MTNWRGAVEFMIGDGFHQPRHVMSQFAGTATRKHGDDGTAGIEAVAVERNPRAYIAA